MRSTGPGLVARSPQEWPWVAASGGVGILLGLVAVFFPGVAIVSVALLLGLGLLVQGVLQVAAALRAGTGASGRGWLIAFGVLALVAGVVVVVHPGVGVLALAWGLTIWFLVAGVNDLLVAAAVREHRAGNLVVGVLSLLAFVLLLFSPGSAVGTIAVFAALGFLFRGAAELGLALTMRRAAR